MVSLYRWLGTGGVYPKEAVCRVDTAHRGRKKTPSPALPRSTGGGRRWAVPTLRNSVSEVRRACVMELRTPRADVGACIRYPSGAAHMSSLTPLALTVALAKR